MKPELHIKKKESLVEMIITALFSVFLAILSLNPNLLAIYHKGGEVTPMLIASSAKSLILGFFLVSLVAVFISLVKLIKKQWSTPLVWANSSSELAGALYFAFFMTRWDVLNKDFIRFFRNDLNTWKVLAKAAVICFLLLTLDRKSVV